MSKVSFYYEFLYAVIRSGSFKLPLDPERRKDPLHEPKQHVTSERGLDGLSATSYVSYDHVDCWLLAASQCV